MQRNWFRKISALIAYALIAPAVCLPGYSLADVDLPEYPLTRLPFETPSPPPPPPPKRPQLTPTEQCIENALGFGTQCMDRAQQAYNACLQDPTSSPEDCQSALDSQLATCLYLYQSWEAVCNGRLPPPPPGF